MKEEKEVIIPTLEEFEKALFEIAEEASLVVKQIYEQEKKKGNVDETGWLNDECGSGSSVLYLKKRSALYKWLNSIPYNPEKFYFILVFDDEIHIALRNLSINQSFILHDAAYQIITDRLKEKFGWEIYNKVRVT
jgi:hypothetical protein